MNPTTTLALVLSTCVLLGGCAAIQPSRCAPTTNSCVEVPMTAEEAAEIDRLEREATTPKPGELGVKLTETCAFWERELADVDPAHAGASAYIARRRERECNLAAAHAGRDASSRGAVVELDVPKRLLGEWVMAPPPHERRATALARHALKSPPNREAFEAMGPSERERRNFDDVVRLREEEPGSPLLAELRRKLDGLEAVRVLFTEDKMITTTPKGTGSTPYVIEDDLGDRVVLLENGDPAKRRVIAFVNDDEIVVTVGATRVPMTRVPAGSAPPPTTAPSVRAAPSLPPAGDPSDPFERCVAEYYACIDKMPAGAREASAEVIEATKGIFERARHSPQDRAATLRSCRQAVDLARMTFCPDGG